MADSDEEDILACVRVGILARLVPGSSKKRCAECRCQVWVSPSGVQMTRTRKLRIVCLECAQKLAAADEEVEIEAPTEEQRGELQGVLQTRLTDEQWQSLKETIQQAFKKDMAPDEWARLRKAIEDEGGKMPSGKEQPRWLRRLLGEQ